MGQCITGGGMNCIKAGMLMNGGGGGGGMNGNSGGGGGGSGGKSGSAPPGATVTLGVVGEPTRIRDNEDARLDERGRAHYLHALVADPTGANRMTITNNSLIMFCY